MKKRFLVVLLTLLLLLVVGGCSDGAQPPAADEPAGAPQEEAADDAPAEEAADKPAPAAGDFTIGFDMNSNACAYCVKFADYIDEMAKAEGMNTIITQSDGDILTQISNAESMLVQGAQVIGGIWGDKDASMPVAEACAQYDVVCVSTLTSLENRGNGYEKYIYLGSENYDGGYLQGQWMADNLPEGTGLWYMGGFSGDQQYLDRRAGMEDALGDAGRDDVLIVAYEDTENYMDRGVDVMENWLQAYDSIDCVVGSADLQIVGAIEAAKAAGRMDNTIWVGFDGQDVALDSIKAGEMSMTIFQDAKSQARAFVDLCVAIRDGADAASTDDIKIPFQVITADNVDEFEW